MSRPRSILKFINTMPFSLTVRHYFAFDDVTSSLKDGKLLSKESWDTLREKHSHFSIPSNREEWLEVSSGKVKKDGQDGGFVNRAREVSELIKRNGFTHIFSVGVGGAGFEYQLKKMNPRLHITCSDYSPVTVKRLSKVFTEADSVTLFDMKKDSWALALEGVSSEKQLCLLYRVDIDLTDDEFRDIFEQMSSIGIKNVLVILCGTLTLRGLLNRLWQRFLWTIQRTKYSLAGYLRTKKAYRNMWQHFYDDKELELGGLKSFLLKKHAS